METIKPISQNPQRYSKKPDKWQISASSSITPIDLPIGELEDQYIPALEVDGIIVMVGSTKLISQRTLDIIRESQNPHYDIRVNGSVMGKKIGGTIPTIVLDVSKLPKLIEERNILNRVGGVTDVEYVTSGEVIEGTSIPKGLVRQINYTLSPQIERGEDRFTLSELRLSDESNYDISSLQITTAQGDTVFDYSKLSEFLKGVKERMKNLEGDFNLIKEIHFSGIIPPDSETYTVNKMAKSEDEQEDGDFQIVYKSSDIASVQKQTAIVLQEEQASQAESLRREISDVVTQQRLALTDAQNADKRTQDFIQRELKNTQNQLASIQKNLTQ